MWSTILGARGGAVGIRLPLALNCRIQFDFDLCCAVGEIYQNHKEETVFPMLVGVFVQAEGINR